MAGLRVIYGVLKIFAGCMGEGGEGVAASAAAAAWLCGHD